MAAVQRIPGVGKKTASRIILELKARSTRALRACSTRRRPWSRRRRTSRARVEALLSMGFTSEEADVALKGAPEGAAESVLLQYALKRLGTN